MLHRLYMINHGFSVYWLSDLLVLRYCQVSHGKQAVYSHLCNTDIVVWLVANILWFSYLFYFIKENSSFTCDVVVISQTMILHVGPSGSKLHVNGDRHAKAMYVKSSKTSQVRQKSACSHAILSVSAFSYWEWTYGVIHTQELAMSYSTCHCFYNQVIATKNNKVLKLLLYNASCNKKHVN